MGSFYTGCKVENHKDAKKVAVVPKLRVDTGSMSTWIAESTLRELGIEPVKQVQFETASGQMVTRSIGFAVLRVDEFETADEVVFAQKGDLPRLGWRALSGMNALVDEKSKRLVDAGPILAAGSERSQCFEPPSPRPSPPGEGEAFARPACSDMGRAVAASQCFNAANVRTISVPATQKTCRRFSLSRGERAGVRASVSTNFISRSTGPRITATR